MKKNLLTTLPVLFILLCGCNFKETSDAKRYDRTKVINELIGDESYIATYHKLPDEETSETKRIKAHLSYVENLLRKKPTAHLTAKEKASRLAILDHLHEYMLAGDFPKNYDIQGERRPCFLDKDGNICAVGYLIEQTESLALACKINSEYKYDWVSDMDMPELNNWIAQSGLTKEECSLIQPSYSEFPVVGSDDVGYTIGFLISAPTLTVTALNFVESFRDRKYNALPILGYSLGAAESAWGIAIIADSYDNKNYIGQGYLHLAIGTLAILSSTSNLIFSNKIPKNENLSIAPTGILTPQNDYLPGIRLTYKF